jgi:predicted  nucleic acid-binding Zn-ribbon protein
LVIVGLALSFLTYKQSNAIGGFQDDIVALKKDLRDDRSKYYGMQADMQQSICKLEENRLKLNDSVDTINSRLAAIIQGVDNYEKNVQALNKKVSGNGEEVPSSKRQDAPVIG